MLQQTRVAAVLPYYLRFMTRFPDVHSLADASGDEVLARWSGLGYYARARNLHRAARAVAAAGGVFPDTLEGWKALPGIGRSTAGAILAQAFGQRHPILDGNVRRLLARHAGVDGWPGDVAVARRLWEIAEARLPRAHLADYTQAQMDLGATVCTARRPRCNACPLAADCVARCTGRVAQLPGIRLRRGRPQRHAVLLLPYDAVCDRWLLERRPPVGLWGGLWCPPLIEDADADWREYGKSRYGVGGAARALPAIDHAFTHFDLHLQPLHLTTGAPAAVLESPARWLTMVEIDALGLPAPVRRLFTRLKNTRCPESFTASSSAPKRKV